jgi:hypothetical protein
MHRFFPVSRLAMSAYIYFETGSSAFFGLSPEEHRFMVYHGGGLYE